jgi:hypothetical protein
MTILLAATAFASRTAAHADVWRDSQIDELEARQLDNVGRNRDTAPRYRRQVAPASHLVDIKRLRAINLKIQPAASQSGPLDYKFLAKSAAGINKLARTLQRDLRFAKTKEHDVGNPDAKPEDLAASVATLRSSITSFADNPVLKNARVADIKLSIKAASDLENVIELSAQVKRICKKLSSSIP